MADVKKSEVKKAGKVSKTAKPSGLPVERPASNMTVGESPKISKSEEERMRRYRAENALHDIERAEGHKRDGKLMKDVRSLAKEKMEAMKKIC